MLEYPLLLVFPVAMAFAAAFDLFTMTIPNKISMVLFAAFFVVAPLSGLPLTVIGAHFATGLVVLVICYGLWTFKGLGGGDAKLLAAASLWIGHESLLGFLLTMGLLGGLLSISVMALRRVPDGMLSGPAWLVRLHGKDSGVPYGLAIGGAALMMYPQTHWYTALFA